MHGVQIIYEDNHIIVAKKPANMPSQADASGDADILGILREYIRVKYNKPGEAYIGLVHRLDRPASGLMVFARTSKAAARLSEQLRQKDIKRRYAAVINGKMPDDAGTLIDFLAKDGASNISRVVPEGASGAKRAVLHYRTEGYIPSDDGQGFSLVSIRLETGRPHQIRLQFSHRGHPLAGDAKYGKRRPGENFLALYAYGLELTHPTLKKRMYFRAPAPAGGIWDSFDLSFMAENEKTD